MLRETMTPELVAAGAVALQGLALEVSSKSVALLAADLYRHM
jgi:hypothetical protein